MDRPTSWTQAIKAFVSLEHSTQSAKHIKPLHQYCVDHLVFSGGFRPELIAPRPPYIAKPTKISDVYELVYAPEVADSIEQTVLGGLKTKDIDVVVSQRCTGPALAISVKGTLGALRNLTNRMEEAAGDCTNLHICYPSLVYGFLHLIRALNSAETSQSNDVAIDTFGAPVEAIRRYHNAMSRIAGRPDLRDDVSRYEAIALVLVRQEGGTAGEFPTYPADESKLKFAQFFDSLYREYDLRYVFPAPQLEKQTQRVTWVPNELTARALQQGFCVRVS